jgi:hypothetical protein
VLLAVFAGITSMLFSVGTAGAAVPEDVVVSKIDASRHPEVSLTVAPSRLLSETDLTQEAFTVTENGAARSASVTRVPNTELQIVMVLDTSVPAAVFRTAQGAALDFLLRLPRGTRVAILSSGNERLVGLPLTIDLGAAINAVGDLDPGPGRAIYDALQRADSEFRPGDQVRRNVLLFSGGSDTSSSVDLDAVRKQMASTNTQIYSVSLGSGDGDDALASIAADAGGQSMRVGTTELVGAYQRVADVLLNQYEVTFQSQSRGDTSLQIDVAAGGFSGSSSVRAQFPGLAEDQEARSVASERSGGRAIVDPLGAALTIFGVLFIGTLLITLGRAGLRSHSTPTG